MGERVEARGRDGFSLYFITHVEKEMKRHDPTPECNQRPLRLLLQYSSTGLLTTE